MVADGIDEPRKCFSARLIESPLQRASILGTPIAVLEIAPFISSLAVVQEGEELYYQQVGATALCDAERMMSYLTPVIGAVMAGRVLSELPKLTSTLDQSKRAGQSLKSRIVPSVLLGQSLSHAN